MRRSTLAVVSLALFTVLVAGLGVYLLGTPQHPVESGRPVQVEVPQGASSLEVGRLLAAKGVVANALMFRVRTQIEAADGRLKAGVYELSTGMTYSDAIAALRDGPMTPYVTLVVPEGWTVHQIADRVHELLGIPAADFEKLATTGAKSFAYDFLASDTTGSLEGYLFPKTYRVRPGSSARDVIGVMLDQFGRETSGLDLTYANAHGVSMHGLVTIASMIERETKVASDRPLVSSVIYNRLARGMYLEIDATVQYVVGNKPRLLYSDLRVKSPYNTYLHKGLPPGPIASPGLPSLQAAAAPADTGYLYYVLTHKDGTHSFTETRDEFLRLKAQAKEGLK